MSAVLIAAAVALAAQPGGLDRARELYQHTEYGAALNAIGPPTTPAETLLAGQAAFQLEDYKLATTHLEKAVELEPGNARAHHWLGKTYGRRAETASFFSAPGLASRCRREFERAVELDPANLDALADLFEYYLEAPGFLGGGRDKAADAARRLGRANGARGENALARMAEKDKKFDEAERHWKRAAELEANEPGRIADVARFLARRGRMAESDEWFEKARKLTPEKPAVWYAQAETWIEAKRNAAEARALLERYIASKALTPDDPTRTEARRLVGRAK
ncbi:MAG: tetratricopeptide repeat protein [Bryobacteraceae bacterium]